MFNLSKISACALAVLVCWSSTVRSQEPAQVPAPPVAPPQTIWRFIGIPQGIQKIRDVRINRRGNFPRLERKPPMKRIADPANLTSDNPAIKAAAEIKQAEDMKTQKIKAIKYLAAIGCGCYDSDGKVSDALIAATDDCTPDVRLAAVEAILEAADGDCCRQCGSTSCCNEDIAKRLSELAYERDDTGCLLEPNADIRAAAKRALCKCCPNRMPMGLIEEDIIEEPQDDADGAEEPSKDVTSESEDSDQDVIGESNEATDEEIEAEASSDDDVDGEGLDAEQDVLIELEPDALELKEPLGDQASTATNRVLLIGGMRVQPISILPASFVQYDQIHVSMPSAVRSNEKPKVVATPRARKASHRSYRAVAGKITSINHESGELLMRADRIDQVNPNGTVDVFHRYLTGERKVGQLQVKQVGSRLVKAKVSNLPNIGRMHVGDRVILR